MYQLAHDALAAYRRDGFTVVDQLVSQEAAEQLQTVLLDLYRRRAGFKEGVLFDAVGLDDGTDEKFLQILNPHWLAPELERSEFHQVGLVIARQILGKTARLRDDVLFLKPPHLGSHTPWHQDIAFCNPQYDHDQITIWLAVTTAGATNSCMSFIPGSHRWPILEHRPMGNDPRVHALECCAEFDTTTAVECPLAAGSATIHDLRTLHYAGANTSDRYRLGYALIFDTKAVLRKHPYHFPWQQHQRMTARAQRARYWRRHGGLVIYAWRQRRRLNFERGMVDLRRMIKALVTSITGRS